MSRRHHNYIAPVTPTPPEPDYFRITNINTNAADASIYISFYTSNTVSDMDVYRNIYYIEVSKDKNFSTSSIFGIADSHYGKTAIVGISNVTLKQGETLYFRNPRINLHDKNITIDRIPLNINCRDSFVKIEGDVSFICGYSLTSNIQIMRNSVLDITDFNFEKLSELCDINSIPLALFQNCFVKSNKFIEIPGTICNYFSTYPGIITSDASSCSDLSNITITTPAIPRIIFINYMFCNNKIITKSPVLKITHTTSVLYAFKDCSNLREITLECRDITLLNNITHFAMNVAAEGIFRCPAELEIPEGSNLIPTGWTRVDL